MEQCLSELFDRFFSLMANVNTEDIPISLFEKDIEEIQESGYEDIMEMIQPNESGFTGTITIKPGSLKGAEYRFNTIPGSTAQENKDKQMASLERLMGVVGKFQNQLKDDQSITVGWAEMLKDYENLSGLPHADKYVRPLTPEEQQAQQQQKQQEMQMEQAKTQAQQQANTITTPGGQVLDATDVVKLYQTTKDPGVQMQILEAFGFQPTVVPKPDTQPTQQMGDTHVSLAANHINSL